MSSSGSIVLFPRDYVHILNEDTGSIRLERGPQRILLKGNEKVAGKYTTTVLTKNQYCVILNPYDPKSGKCIMGERKVVEGPCEFALYYNELIEDRIKEVPVLRANQAIELESQQDHIRDGKKCPAGFKWQIRGPCRYVPGKYEKETRRLDAILINENSGIYVQNSETSQKKLIVGPKAYLLGVNEQTWKKSYTKDEIEALGLPLAPSHVATTIYVKRGEIVCVLNYEDNTENVLIGPCSKILGPSEGVKVLSISAGVPKQVNRLKIAKLRLGPDFMSDKFSVRTKDNTQLTLHLTYKWRFCVDESDAYKAFNLKDFIGYACNTLCSEIREEAARHVFEEFHNNTAHLIQKVLFKEHVVKYDSGKEEKVFGLYFPENKFLVSEVDVKSVVPANPEINQLLNQSIKNNMEIVCKKMEQEANLDAQKGRVKAQAEIQRLREKLIDVMNKNLALEQVEKAKIEGQALIEKAKAEKEAIEIKSKGHLALEIEEMKKTMELLETEEGLKYLELLKVENFSQVPQQWYLTSKSHVSIL